jgi:fatty-acyl-CoA synthase
VDFKKITIGKLVDDNAAENPENDPLVSVDRGLRLHYREFREECRAVARGLMSLGIRKGDHIGIWATNVPEWAILQFASARIGAVLITINTQYRPFELEYILRQSDTKLLILSDGSRTSAIPGRCSRRAPRSGKRPVEGSAPRSSRTCGTWCTSARSGTRG